MAMASALVVVGALLCPLVLFAAELSVWKPNLDMCSQVLADFTPNQHISSPNVLGGSFFSLDGMITSMTTSDQHLRLDTTGATDKQHPMFYISLRNSNTCFDTSNFDYLSITYRTNDDFVVAFSANNRPCEDVVDNAYEYAMLRISNTNDGDDAPKRIDIPWAMFGWTTSPNNTNAMMVGANPGAVVDIYDIVLRARCDVTVSNKTILNPFVAFLIEDFQLFPNLHQTWHLQLHSDDGSMKDVKVNQTGVSLTSKAADSYWYTLLPDCMSVEPFDELVMTVNGPVGADFEVQVEVAAKDTCDKRHEKITIKASDFLNGPMNGADQQLVVPFAAIPNFDKTARTIMSVIVGRFLNKNEGDDNATAVTIVIKSVDIRWNGDGVPPPIKTIG